MRHHNHQHGGPRQRSGEQNLNQNTEELEQNDGSPGRGGPRRPELDDLTQEAVNNEDGSIDISVSGTNVEGEVHTYSVNISDNETGGISIIESRTEQDDEEIVDDEAVDSEEALDGEELEAGEEIEGHHEGGHQHPSGDKVVTISEDAEDGGVDMDIVVTNEDGETFTKHIELDLNEDGSLSIEEAFDRDGELIIHNRDVDLAVFLGEEGEVLNVAEVVEAYLDKGPIDMTDVELTGLNNLMTGADFFEI